MPLKRPTKGFVGRCTLQAHSPAKRRLSGSWRVWEAILKDFIDTEKNRCYIYLEKCAKIY